MNLLRRFTAVVSSALLLQLSLLASGTLCPMHGDHAAASAGEHVAAMAHDHGTVATSGTDAMQKVSDPSSVTTSHPAGACDMNGSSCGMPWSPGSCTSMTTCAIGTSAPGSASLAFVEFSSAAVVSHSAAELPIGPTYAPELPPPRA